MSQGRHTDFDVRIRAINAVKRGLPTGQVADTFGVNRTTLFRWLQRFRENGQNGLQRQIGSGRRRLLEDLTEADLRRLILFPASDFGYETDLWTVGRVKHVIEELVRRPYFQQYYLATVANCRSDLPEAGTAIL